MKKKNVVNVEETDLLDTNLPEDAVLTEEEVANLEDNDCTEPIVVNADGTVELPEELDIEVESETEVENETEVESEVANELPEVKGVVTAAKLNVRELPNKDAKVVTILNKGDVVVIDNDAEEAHEEFFKIVTADGLDCYCMKKFIELK